MQFACGGRQYDTAHMTAYLVEDPSITGIYVTQDAGRPEVFVSTLTRWEGVNVHCAEPAEIRRLAQRFNLPELLKTLE